jgi:hypothetical protein
MKRAIVVVATTLILTAGQAMAEELTLPRHVNGSSPGFREIRCICTCLDEPGCCYTCFDYGPGGADNRPHQVGYRLRELSRISPNIAHPKQSTPYISSERSCSAASCVGSPGAM